LETTLDRFSFDYPCSAPARIDGEVRYISHDSTNGFRCAHERFWFQVLVGSPGGWMFQEDREWLVTVHPLAGIGATLMRGKADAACRTVCRRLDQILKMDPRFTRIRWHTEQEWNAGAEASGSEAP
jgi:hypothetical protein